jgi:phospholipase C
MMRPIRIFSILVLLAMLLGGIAPVVQAAPAQPVTPTPAGVLLSPSDGITTATPIKHLIVLMQENHTFDNYFGTYPGADGLPANVKMPVDPSNPKNNQFVAPFHIGDMALKDLSHSAKTFNEQYNNGRMDGFVSALDQHKQDGRLAMGYYDGTDIPYYWNLADNYVLFDRLFSSAKNGSFDNHMFLVAARPPKVSNVALSDGYADVPTIFDRLQAKGVPWKYYTQNYDPTITYRDVAGKGNRESQVLWVPLLNFDRFIDNPSLSNNIVDLNQIYDDLHGDSLPAVSFITPSGASEHPPGSIQTGQAFSRSLIQEVMRSKYWDSTAFLLMYDDWGGWYDHVVPPQVDSAGYGLRVPGILVSAYARQGFIDSTQLDFTSALKFIEQNWNVQPLTNRDARANTFIDAFNFDVGPRPPVFVSSVRTTSPAKTAVPIWVIVLAYAIAILLPVGVIGTALVRSFMLSSRQSKLKSRPYAR